jgi:hypothetical protein
MGENSPTIWSPWFSANKNLLSAGQSIRRSVATLAWARLSKPSQLTKLPELSLMMAPLTLKLPPLPSSLCRE